MWHPHKLGSIMADKIHCLLAFGGCVPACWPAVFSQTGPPVFRGRDSMRVRRKYVPLVALLAACLTAGAQISPAPNSAPKPESQSGSPHSPQATSPPVIQTARAVHSLLPEQAAQQRPVLL